jgi:hypothetical protein
MQSTQRCLFLALGLLGCALSLAADDVSLNSDRARWQREDLKVYRQKFLAVDRSFSADARAAVNERLARIETAREPLSPTHFAVELCRITALADNGHTQCMSNRVGRIVCERFAALVTDNSPWCNVQEPDYPVPEFRSVPVGFHVFGDSFHVVRVPEEHADLLGAKLIAIDGKPIESIRAQLRTFAGGTTAHRDEVAAGVLASPPQLHGAQLSDRDDSLQYDFSLQDGRTIKRRFSLGSASDATQWRTLPYADRTAWSLQQPEKPFRFRDAPEVDALAVQLRQILDAEDQTLAAFLESMEDERARLGRSNIVLDMRENGGGNLLLARDFMNAWPSRVPGKFYVLTSRTTFSAAIASIAYLKQAGGDRVGIIGEPVGDRLMFFSDGLPVQLPHSGLFFLPAVIRMDYAHGCREYDDCFEAIVEEGRPTAVSLLKLPPDLKRMPLSVGTLEPDVMAPWTLDSWLRGTDPAMDAIAALVNGERRNESATPVGARSRP